jgi:hypothetical protein
MLPALEKTLKKLCRRYVRLQSANRGRQIAVQIRDFDSAICLIQRGEAAVIRHEAYLYYRDELESVGVSAEVGIRPLAVCQILWKMNRLWEREFAPDKTALPDFDTSVSRAGRLA